jgi:hypothetical protein
MAGFRSCAPSPVQLELAMNPESASKIVKARIICFHSRDDSSLIRQNASVIASSFFLLDSRKREVVVRDANPADMKIRSCRPGDAIPLGTKTVDDVLYRFYLVCDELLGTLQAP